MACTLCDLPTPDPPVSDDDVDGTFCCRGCLEVSRALDADDASAADVDGAEGVRAALESDGDDTDTDPDDTDAVMLIITGDGASDTFPAVHDDVDPRTASLWLLAAHIHHVASAARASGDGTATMQDVAHDAIQLLSDHHDAPVETFSTGGGGQ